MPVPDGAHYPENLPAHGHINGSQGVAQQMRASYPGWLNWYAPLFSHAHYTGIVGMYFKER